MILFRIILSLHSVPSELRLRICPLHDVLNAKAVGSKQDLLNPAIFPKKGSIILLEFDPQA